MSASLSFDIPPGLPHQHELWADETHEREVAMIGPLGTGKSLALGVKMVLLAAANAGLPGALVVPSYVMFDKIHRREWPILLSGLGLSVKIISHPNPVIRLPWSDVLVYTADKPEAIAGTNLAYALGDEPALWSRATYERITARVRHPQAVCRHIALVGTPEGLPSWFADEFNIDSIVTSKNGWTKRTIRATTWHPDMAHYPGRLKQTYGHDPALLRTYARGEFVALGAGLAYHAFSRENNVRDIALESGLPIELACDFNIDAMRWLVCQRTPHELRVVDEIAPGRHCPVPDAAAAFMERYGDSPGRLAVYGDAAGSARTSQTGTTCYSELRQALMPVFGGRLTTNVPNANPPVRDRVNTVNYHLAGRGGLELVVSPRCRELIADFERVAWRKNTSDIDKNTDPLRTHASDALGYWLWRAAPLIKPAPARVADLHNAEGYHDPMMEMSF